METTQRGGNAGEPLAVKVSGEVDVSNASELRTSLDEAIAGGARTVVADLSEVSYMDSTGIGVLVGVARKAAEEGVAFSVAHPQRNVARVFDLLGVADELKVDRS